MRVITPDVHRISPNLVSEAAVKVVSRLKSKGYEAYIVGGAVRDLLLGGQPKDFDVGTNATPEQIKAVFKNARIIGRRFQIVHVRFGPEIIEVTTYRGHHASGSAPASGKDSGNTKAHSRQSDKGLLLRDNVYGTLEEDAARRDLTINALYYDPEDESVLDQLNGMADVEARLVRVIGEPHTRYREDPVRMLRVLRFAAKLQFDVESETDHAIAECAPLLAEIPSARLFDEFLKLFMAGYATPTFKLLYRYGLLHHLFPEPTRVLAHEARHYELVVAAMESTDRRVREDRPVTPAFLLAAIMWPVVQERAAELIHAGETAIPAFHSSGQQVVAEVCVHTAIPKRFSLPMREMWDFQPKLERRQPKQIKSLLASRRFRAAYDLLLLREASGEKLNDCGQFWTEQQEIYPDLVGSAPRRDPPPNRRRGRRRRTPQ
ncbi:poly(A) polymerase [Luminiphilus syltensis NOR5-1B]|uniref:Poly(A) polymerase I n=1 Tax=Luminiphilus syltensis NOR5-1B TaxID=565045 RepID=B8KRY4_9GAMM|nr:polynucleotide adenylyltransferase PcnB [Luminiphilus syltensis]EED34884.1 poly(A) polymerase [Luminiphilus syltensis NOR5-1B]